jgi:uncharacterized membrane protein (DUF2068 family)
MERQDSRSAGTRAERLIALALCGAVGAVGAVGQLLRNRPADAQAFAPEWLPLVAAGLAAAGLVQLAGSQLWLRVRRVLSWAGLLLMVWTANGLPFDLLRVVGLIPLEVDWPGLATRTIALATAVVLARLALRRPPSPAPTRPASWYGYAAFVLALPYPALRTVWALGGTLGLAWPGAAGVGFEPWLISIPWLLAAAVSLLLVSPSPRVPRRLLLVAGWTATAIVAMIGPAAFWSLVKMLVVGGDAGAAGMATWVPALFYGSWFLWAIAGAAATRSYQLRSEAPRRAEAPRVTSPA